MGKKGKKNEEDYLASLAGEDEEEQVTTAPQPTNNKKQQKNNKKSVVSDDDDEDNSEEEVMVSMKPKKQQPKKKKGNAPSAKTNAFALLDDDEDNNMPASDSDNDNEDSEDDFVAKPKTKPNKKQKKKQQKSMIDDLDEDDESVAAVDQKSDNEESDDDYVAPPTKSNNKKKKGGAAAAAASASTTAKKAPQGKKGKKAKNDDDYLSSLAAADEEENQDAAVTQSASKKGGNKVEDDDDEDDGGIPLDQRDPSTLSAKEKKKLKKMRQKDEKKEEKKPAEKKKDEKKKDEKKKDEKKKPAAEEKKGGAPKKVNAGIAALKAAMEKKKQEEERIRQEEERRIREEEAALKLLEDQKRQEELEKKKIKDDKKKKELDLKNKGLWKSKKQLEQEKMARLRAESFIAQGLIPGREPSSKKKPAAQKKPAAETKKPAAPQPAKKVAEPTKPKPVEEEQPTPQEHDEDEYGSAFDNEPEATPVEQAAEEEEDEGVEDWEDLEDVLEDKPSAKEEEKKKQQAAAEAKRKQEELAKKKAQELANRKEDDSQKDEDSQTSDDVNKHKGNADLRSPICCVLGHVDTGKTKLLDKIRNTNVQTGEAGGITQQIGATYVPIDAVKRQTKRLNELTKGKLQYNLPGLLIIDTPGHESFTNLRSRGSSLCDIAILVVDILHGLERQTLESINLLRQRKTPFIVALNKIDTIYGWKATPNSPIKESLKNQPKHTLEQFEENVRKTIALFNGEGFNAELYYKNKDIQNYVSLVPTSAITGEGLPDLLALMCQLCQKHMVKRITLQSKFQCTILEVKVIDGHGTTIDVILSNGMIREGDRIVVCTLNGPVVTCIRALLTPQPLKELRVKGEYMHHKEIRASQGIKISAPDLEGAVAGSQVLLVRDGDDVEELKDEVMSDLNDLLSRIAKTGKGVYVQSSTLGSLEALLEFLHSEKIPVSGINIGPVHKKDIVKTSVMLETHPEYAVLLAFDVPISKEAEDEAQKMGVKIFRADIIYHLFDQFMAHTTKIKEEKKKNTEKEVVWPCVLKISETNIFRQKDPITVGVDIVEGVLRLNTPLVIPTRGFLSIGRVIGIQHQKVSLREAERGKSVAIQIDAGKTIQYGRHFNHSDLLYSRLTRDSIDMLKELFGDELKKDKELLLLIVKLKKILNIQ